MLKPQATSKIDGISVEETRMLQAVLLFARSAKPHEICEVKLKDNDVGQIAIRVKSQHQEVFDI